MRTELPLFIQSGTADLPRGVTTIRPLFFGEPCESDREIAKARARLALSLRKRFGEMGRDGKHRELAGYTFCPKLRLHSLKFRVDLRRQSFHGSFPVVVFPQLSRRIAFSPLLMETWFEVGRGQTLQSRALEVYTEFFRGVEKTDEHELAGLLERFAPAGKSWIDYLEIDIDAGQKPDRKGDDLLALLGSVEHVDGARELERVGTCLDHMYPEQLRRFHGADSLLDEVQRHLEGAKRRAVMVAGPPLVGKTTLVHELVFRRVNRRRSPFHRNGNVWHLAPQRLISGMMYLGQWENRLLAILKHARKRDHVLFFDDLLGLYHAGRTSNSDLSVGDVLKPYVERGDVRVLAEMTPEALRVFRERDRSFADLFHLVSLEEPPPEKLVPSMLARIRSLELRHDCRFGIEVLPAVLELTRRYQPGLSYPGKAAILLERLASAGAGAQIDRSAVLDQFQRQSGLDARFLDRHVRLPRPEIAKALEGQIVGQREAVEAMVDVVGVAKARLNDPQRPLASMLFLGPTGVGKTECAKALARFLFHDEDRLLRFDMNEFLSADAAARLTGTFDRPEGLLTSAIRERPAAVVLLDEIEKAHPNVFDLLLQILGDARLTDALGRTVDFSSAVVILTSNLGTGQTSIASGFGPADTASRDMLLKAVREFFRPELLNRLDRIIPFARLSGEELAAIARRTLSLVLAREGFQRRQSALDLSPQALSWVVEQGCHPELGARAMKRAVEEHVVHPLAIELAGVPTTVPTVISLARSGNCLDVEVAALREAEPCPGRERSVLLTDRADVLARARQMVDRVERDCRPHKNPQRREAGRFEFNDFWYLAVSEYLVGLQQRIRWLDGKTRKKPVREIAPAMNSPQPRRRTAGFHDPGISARQILKEMVAAQDIHDYLAELRREARTANLSVDHLTEELAHLCDELAVLHAFQPTEQGWPHQHVVVMVRSLSDGLRERACLAADILPCHGFQVPSSSAAGGADGASLLHGLMAAHWPGEKDETTAAKTWWEMFPDLELDRRDLRSHHLDVLAFEGPLACFLLKQHQGTYLFTDREGRLRPVQVVVLPAESPERIGRVLAEYLKGENAEGDTHFPQPGLEGNQRFRWQPVVAVYAWQTAATQGRYRRMIDFRRGLRATTSEGIDPVAAFRSSLPLPPELQE